MCGSFERKAGRCLRPADKRMLLPASFMEVQACLASLPPPPADLHKVAPLMMDLFSGPNAPLAKAFLWCGWRVLTPIDLAIDEEFDVTWPAAQQAILKWLPQVSLQAAAFDCSTKTRPREKRPGPMPFRSETLPRGLPGLSARDQHRVDQGNLAADFGLAMQQWGASRENPLNSLHWFDPCERYVTSQSSWHDLVYDASVFMGARKNPQRIRHNLTELCKLPDLRCGHIHAGQEWVRQGDAYVPYQRRSRVHTLIAIHTCHMCHGLGTSTGFHGRARSQVTSHLHHSGLSQAFGA